MCQAKIKAAQQALTLIDFLVGDLEDIDLPSDVFDIIFVANAFAYIADVPALLRRMHAWLKPGGRLIGNNPQACSLCHALQVVIISCTDAVYVLPRPEIVKELSKHRMSFACTYLLLAAIADSELTGMLNLPWNEISFGDAFTHAVLQAPMLRSSAPFYELLAEMFQIHLDCPAAELGSADRFAAALKGAGFSTVKACLQTKCLTCLTMLRHLSFCVHPDYA